MKQQDKYVDEIYHFKGEWEVPSSCGLKIVKKSGSTIVVVTEFYDSNPGTSVTNWNHHLASEICSKYGIKPTEMIFIERSPRMSSKLSFYDEIFDIVSFSWDDSSFSNPKWKRITKEKVDELLNTDLE